jgi:ADP-ribose pyrophosphatase YjhB (NUDIX family)
MPETVASDLVALVSPDDQPIGAVPKAELGRVPGLHFRTVHVFIEDERGRLLLQQLAPRRDRNPLRWGSSVAAYVRDNESYEEAALRRSREELGVEPDLYFIARTKMPDLRGTKHISLFAARVARPDVRILEPEHIARLKWSRPTVVALLTLAAPARFTETFVWLVRHLYPRWLLKWRLRRGRLTPSA